MGRYYNWLQENEDKPDSRPLAHRSSYATNNAKKKYYRKNKIRVLMKRNRASAKAKRSQAKSNDAMLTPIRRDIKRKYNLHEVRDIVEKRI